MEEVFTRVLVLQCALCQVAMPCHAKVSTPTVMDDGQSLHE
jgi:hypothetical protein